MAVLLSSAALVRAQRVTAQTKSASAVLSPAQMFAAAEKAERRGDFTAAEAIYRALTADRSMAFRNEARFRLGMLLARKRRYTQAAVLFRKVLDEEPTAQRVRLELAYALAKMGDEDAARREIRAAQAGGLPAEVAQLVDRFSAALRSQKPFGGSFEVAIASDSNINRATRSDTLGTVLGNFILDKSAKAHSGEGLAVSGEAYCRLPLGKNSALLVSATGFGDYYRQSKFDDVNPVLRAGPELALERVRVDIAAGIGRRWFGTHPFTDSVGGKVDLIYPVSSVTQFRLTATGDHLTNHFDALESGSVFSGTAVLEQSISERAGIGLAFAGARRALRDRGYSTTSVQATLFGYREIAHTTIATSLSIGRLVADRRLLLFPEKRSEWLFRGTFGATMRQFTFAGFAPTAQLTVERNHSTVELYDYNRTALELGVTRAF